MYQNYFGFKERPFQLVPNPAYLFLSSSHEEAMAHLTYAVSEGDGFITITGEVGTGKTTLCRAFIEGLDDRSEVAYIFNPKLTAVELLKAVCDEFGINAPSGGTTKDLIDIVNRFLLEKKAEGKQVMLIIDEAQNLSREVLEQIRLLSNLETNTEKLLQIVLAGQPEMDDLLETYELRQLSQRITLSCHLIPLTYKESVQYIQHRIRIAARNEGVVFSKPAFRKIYTFSKGVPRLIHIICDRALLTAYVTNHEKITGPIVDAALKELKPRLNIGRLRTVEKTKTALLGALLCLVLVLLFVLKPIDSDNTPGTGNVETFKIKSTIPEETPPPATPADGEPASSETAAAADPAISSAGSTESPPFEAARFQPTQLENFLAGIDRSGSKKIALSGALALWGTSLPIREYMEKELVDPTTYFNLTAKRNGFLIHRIKSSRKGLSRLNLPVIFEFALPGVMGPYYLTLSRMDGEALIFIANIEGDRLVTSTEDVDRLWTGFVYIPWTNFLDYEGVTPISGAGKDVLTLKQILEKIGYRDLPPGPDYDTETESVIREIQHQYGIPVDGLVGPLTKMALYNELSGLDIPHIRETDDNFQTTEPKVTD